MTDEDRKFLTEKIGEKWANDNPFKRTFNKWRDFGAVWEWAQGQEWWSNFS